MMSTAGKDRGNPTPAMRIYSQLEEPVVVIGREFVVEDNPVELIVAPTSGSRKEFEVKDVDGTLIFQMKKKVASIHKLRYLQGPAGNTIITLRRKVRSTHGRWNALRGKGEDENDVLFTAKWSSKLPQKRDTLNIFLASNKHKQVPDFKVTGNWLHEKSFEISLGGSNTIIAEVTAKRGCIAVNIWPSVDYAFIMALVMCLASFASSNANSCAPSLALHLANIWFWSISILAL